MEKKDIISNTEFITTAPESLKKQELLTELMTKGEYKYLKESLAEDVLNMFHFKNYTVDNLKDDSQLWWFNLLNKVNNPILKSITNNNFYLNEIIMPHYFEALDKILEYAEDLDKQARQEASSGKSTPSLSDLMNNSKPNNKGKNKNLDEMVNNILKKAEEKIQEEIANAPEELLDAGKDGDNNDSGCSVGDNPNMQLSPQGLESLYALQKRIKFKKEPLNNFINKTIVKLKNDFKNPSKTQNVSFLDSDNFSDLFDIEYLAIKPLIFLEQVYTKTQLYGTVVNVSVDQSSSMSTNVSLGQSSVYLPDLCKYLVYAMAKNNIVEDVSVFDTQVYEITLEKLLNNRFSGGGTRIDNVIKYYVNKGNEPLLIITDKQKLCPTIMRK